MTAQPNEQPIIIEAAGVYDDIPEAVYHADPVKAESLSQSGCKKLLEPSCPAIYRYEKDHGQGHKRVFDFGHAAHAAVLGIGLEVVVVRRTEKDGTSRDADSYSTNSAKEHRDAIYAAGKAPLLASELTRVNAMAAKLREHPVAAALLNPDKGKPEQSLFAQDPASGTWLRGRLDWLDEPDANGHLTVADYKTAAAVDLNSISRSAASYGYDMQYAFYKDLCRLVGIAEDVTFRFIFQMKEAPFLVSVIELDDLAEHRGRTRNRQAIDLHAECQRTGHWPDFTGNDIPLVGLPQWATYELDMDVI